MAERPARLGLALLAAVALSASLAPWLAPYPPRTVAGRPFEPPSAAHPLGTNDIGNDLLSELLWGGRVSLVVGTLAALAAVALGGLLGLAAGYFGGPLGTVVMRLADVMLVLPLLPLLILLAAFLGPQFWTLVAVITLVGWARPCRLARAEALSLRGRPYVEAARALGASDARLLGRHLLPALWPLLVAQFVLTASFAILMEASLSFLGLGDPVARSWGTMLYYAQAKSAFQTGAWLWWVLPPGLMITLTVLGFALVGLAIEALANPAAAGALRGVPRPPVGRTAAAPVPRRGH